MKASLILGIALIVLGAAILGYHHFSYTTTETFFRLVRSPQPLKGAHRILPADPRLVADGRWRMCARYRSTVAKGLNPIATQPCEGCPAARSSSIRRRAPCTGRPRPAAATAGSARAGPRPGTACAARRARSADRRRLRDSGFPRAAARSRACSTTCACSASCSAVRLPEASALFDVRQRGEDRLAVALDELALARCRHIDLAAQAAAVEDRLQQRSAERQCRGGRVQEIEQHVARESRRSGELRCWAAARRAPRRRWRWRRRAAPRRWRGRAGARAAPRASPGATRGTASAVTLGACTSKPSGGLPSRIASAYSVWRSCSSSGGMAARCESTAACWRARSSAEAAPLRTRASTTSSTRSAIARFSRAIARRPRSDSTWK